MRAKHLVLVLLAAVLVAPIALAGDGERREERDHDRELREIMEGLEQGIRALRALDRPDEAERLLRIAREVGEELEQREKRRAAAEKELAAARHEVEVYRVAMHALREAERPREMEALERVIHALELSLEGHRGDEVREAWKKAPDRADRIEILLLAGRLWEKFERPERAEVCFRLARKFQEQQERRRKGGREREMAKKRLEILRLAMKAMLEAERREAAERIEHAIHALELALEGRTDAKAKRIRETAPKAGQLAELLHLAARIWDGFGHEEKAARCLQLGVDLAAQTHRRDDAVRERKEHRERERRDEDLRKHVEHLHHRLEELTREVERLRQEVTELKRRR